MLSNQQLGSHGQSVFKTICTSMGITVTKPEEDINGWDFYLEFPTATVKGIFDTTHTSNLQCKVQVKSSYHKDGNRAVHLSTLKILTTDSLPAFIVFLEFNGSDELDAFFTTHIESTLSFRILKKVKESETKERNTSKLKLTILKSERLELTTPYSTSLDSYFRKIIGDIEDYKISKINELKNLGYENGFFEAKLIIPDLEKAIADSFSDNHWIPIDEFTMRDCRFGILGKEFGKENGQLFISGLAETLDGEIAFATDSLHETLVFDATLVKSSLTQLTTPENVMFLVKTTLFDVLVKGISKSGNNINLTVHNEVKARLSVVLRLLKLFSLLKTSKTQTTAELRFWETPVTCKTQPSRTNNNDLEDKLNQLSQLRDIFTKYFDLDLIYLTVDDTYRQELSWKNLLGAISIDLSKNVVAFQCPDREKNKHKKGCGLVVFLTPFGDKHVVSILALTSDSLTPIPEGYVLTHPSNEIAACYLLENIDANRKALILDDIEKIVKFYAKRNYFVFKDLDALKQFPSQAK